jgi:hypothetical protein
MTTLIYAPLFFSLKTTVRNLEFVFLADDSNRFCQHRFSKKLTGLSENYRFFSNKETRAGRIIRHFCSIHNDTFTFFVVEIFVTVCRKF